jgi:virginiamycin B lyase
MRTAALLLSISTAVVACNGGGSAPPPFPPNPVGGTPGTTTVAASVAPLPGASISNLVAVSSLDEHPLAANGGATSFTVPTDGGAVVGVMDTSRSFGWTAVSATLSQPNAQIGPLSTAVQMVFIVPGIFTGDPAQRTAVLQALSTVPDVQAFGSVLNANAASQSPLDSPDVATAYAKAVNSGRAVAQSVSRRFPSRISQIASTVGIRDVASNLGGLNDFYAGYSATPTSNGVTLQPQWSGAQPIGQALYWTGAVYKVDLDTKRYPSRNAFTQALGQDPWTVLPVTGNSPVGIAILPPTHSLWNDVNVSSDLTDALVRTDSASASVTVPNDSAVYEAHLYTCSVGTSPAKIVEDFNYIHNWDAPVARNLRLSACGINISMAALTIVDLVLGSGTLKQYLTPKEIADILAAATTVAQGQAAFDTSNDPRELGKAFANVVQSTLITVLAKLKAKAATRGIGALFNFFDVGARILGAISDAGNIGDVIGSMVVLEPWQGEYLIVGDPWATASPSPPTNPPPTNPPPTNPPPTNPPPTNPPPTNPPPTNPPPTNPPPTNPPPTNPPSEQPGSVSEFPIPLNNFGNIADNRANGITAGRDLALWFTFGSVGAVPTIGRMTTNGNFTKYALSSSETQPWGIVAGSDGALWFTEVSTNKIGRMSTSGQLLQEFTIPTPTSYPYGLVFGSDGALWFIECRAGANKIGRLTMAGQFQEFPVNAGINGTPEKITAGQGVLWFTESDAGRIGRINIDGTGYQDYFIGNGAVGHGIAFGPDGALWFTARDSATIGHLTTSGQYTAYPLFAGQQPQEIVYGPDGAMWFTVYNSMIGRITTSGQVNAYSVPQTDSHPFAITQGPDAALWFTDNGGQAKQIGRIATSVSHQLSGARQPTRR